MTERGLQTHNLIDYKIPPQSIEHEEGLICAILLGADPEDLGLLPDNFYRTANQKIFSAALELRKKNEPIDIVSMSTYLRDMGLLEDVGGASHLARVVETVPMAGNVEYYAGKIKEKYNLRRVIEIANNASNACFGNNCDVNEIIGNLQKESMAINVSEKHKTVLIKDILPDLIDGMEEAYEKGGNITGVPTGFSQLDAILSGLQPSDLIIIAGRPAMGKELSVLSKILLKTGEFKYMANIGIGDEVASIDGGASFVTGVYPQGIKPVYKITFSDGRWVCAGLNHQWEVSCRHWKSPRIMTTADLINKIKRKRYQKRMFIPNHSGDFGEDRDLLIDPYLLGVLIGDGGLSGGGVKITTSYRHILDKIKPMLLNTELRLDQKITYRLSTNKGVENKIISALKIFGLYGKRSHEKFIPERYLSASKNARIEFMRGLIDTDGEVGKTGSMVYSTSSEELACDIQQLARSLGAFASKTSRFTKYTYKGIKKTGKRAYRIYISCKNYSNFVTTQHKKKNIKNKSNNQNLNIESIDYVSDIECQCISVSHKRELYLTDDYITTHNTAFGVNIAKNAAERGFPGLIFSLEMPRTQLLRRMLSEGSKINSARFRKCDFQAHQWKQLTEYCSRIEDLPIHINDDPGIKINEIRSVSRKFKKSHNIKFVIIDYLQLMVAESKAERRDLDIADISRSLKIMARELEIPIIALSQVNRMLEQRNDRRPRLSDLRESGALEQDADVVMFVYRDEVYNKDENNPEKGIAEIIIAKQRNGPVGFVKLAWLEHYTVFHNLAHREE